MKASGRKRSLTGLLAVVATMGALSLAMPAAWADGDPFPGTGDGNRIPGSPTLSGTRDQPQPSGDSLGCPSGSAAAVEQWTNDGHWEMYCIKRWTPPSQVNDEANRAAAEGAARAQAEAEAAARPGVEVCRTWSYTYSNGVSTASGSVCTTVPVLTDGVNVPGPTTSSPTPAPTRPANPDVSREPWYMYEPNYVPGTCGLTVTVSGPIYSYTRPFSAGECAQREIDSSAWQARSLARERAQAQAASRPGIRVCTPWSTGSQSGQECAFEPLRGVDQAVVSVPVTPIIADPSAPLEVTAGWQSLAPGITAGTCGLVMSETNVATGTSFRRPFSIAECAQRALDIAATSARAQAAATAEAAARRTPGVEICTPWNAGSQSGRECRTRPIGLDEVLDTGDSSSSDAQATVIDGVVTPSVLTETASLTTAKQIARTTLAVFRNQVVATSISAKARTELTRSARSLDSVVPSRASQGTTLALLRVGAVKVKSTSLTPKTCRVQGGGRTVSFVEPGTCILGFTLTHQNGPAFRLGQTVAIR